MSLAVWIGFAIAGILLVRWARRRWFIAIVRGRSMLPTLGHGQRLIVRRAHGDRAELRVGDIVVLTVPEHERIQPLPGSDYLVKRVAALGDRVVVLGDNPPASQDSRHFGPVDRRSILGIASFGAQRLDRLNPGGVVRGEHPGDGAERGDHAGRGQRDGEVGVGRREREVGEQ